MSVCLFIQDKDKHKEKQKILNTKMFQCVYCCKEYTRKSSYSRHLILCEIIFNQNSKSRASLKREEKCEEEESPPNIPIPTLYRIVQELALENKHMKQQVEEIRKYISINVNKIDVINMLNSPSSPIPVPSITCDAWKKEFKVEEEDVRNLENMVETIHSLIKKNLNPNNGSSNSPQQPFISFAQKKHIIYIYGTDQTWKKQTPEDFVSLLKFIHSKIARTLSCWYKSNKEAILRSERMSDEYQKNLNKLMSLDFNSVTTNSKIRSYLYNLTKIDLTTIQYE